MFVEARLPVHCGVSCINSLCVLLLWSNSCGWDPARPTFSPLCFCLFAASGALAPPQCQAPPLTAWGIAWRLLRLLCLQVIVALAEKGDMSALQAYTGQSGGSLNYLQLLQQLMMNNPSGAVSLAKMVAKQSPPPLDVNTMADLFLQVRGSMCGLQGQQ